jgi:hypothetical protein
MKDARVKRKSQADLTKYPYVSITMFAMAGRLCNLGHG